MTPYHTEELLFQEFPKMARLSREMWITEKLDGTNAGIYITDDGQFHTQSRTRIITPEDDNYGFSRWANENREELMKLGPGRHFGEWWGSGINRSYGLQKGEKRFSLFNVQRWKVDSFEEKGFEAPPKCCSIVPVLYKGMFDTAKIQEVLDQLIVNGSYAEPGFHNPEGIVVWHTAANFGFKKTILKDESRKSLDAVI